MYPNTAGVVSPFRAVCTVTFLLTLGPAPVIDCHMTSRDLKGAKMATDLKFWRIFSHLELF